MSPVLVACVQACVLRPCSCTSTAADRAADGAARACAVGTAAFVTQDVKCFCPPVNPWPLALPPGFQPPAAAPGASSPAPAPAPAGNLSAAGVAAAGPGNAPAGGNQGGGLSQVGARATRGVGCRAGSCVMPGRQQRCGHLPDL